MERAEQVEIEFEKIIGVQLIYKIVLVSGVQESVSVIHIHRSIFSRFFPIKVITGH